MTGRSHSMENNKKQPVSPTPAQGMFQPRPFAVQPQTEELEQPDLKTALQRAERYGHHLDRIKSIKPPVQAKLTIGQPGDRYEQEADRVASQVVNSFHAPTAQRQEMPEEDELQMKPEIGSIQRQELPEEDEELQMKAEALQREGLSEGDEELQMKPMVQLQANQGESEASPDLEHSIKQARGGGQSLDRSIREPIEQAMGADFSGVKIHTDTQADQLNRSVQAKAFTTGQDVFFRQGEYNPGSREGQELIAHELTHVVQQGDKTALQRASDALLEMVKGQDQEKLKQEVNQAMTKIQNKIAGASKEDAMIVKMGKIKGRDMLAYSTIAYFRGTKLLDQVKGWNPNWSIKDTAGLLLDVAYEARKSRDWVDKRFKSLNEALVNARGDNHTLNEESDWVRSMREGGFKLKSGPSASTGNLLKFLEAVKEVTPSEIEAIVSAVTLYWNENLGKRLTRDYHTAVEVWAAYNHHLEEVRALAPTGE